MINQILQSQKENGSFGNSILFTSLILSCLSEAKKTPKIKSIKEKAFEWLLKQKDNEWNFDQNLGVNFCALIALFKHNPTIINGSTLAKILMLLISRESQEGGPYYTSLNNKTIDLGINIVVAYFLFLQKVNLPKLDEIIKKAIQEKNFESKLFENNLFSIYFISKMPLNKAEKENLIEYLLEKTSKKLLEELLINISLNNLGYKKDLKEKQKMSEIETAFYLEAVKDKKIEKSTFDEKELLAIEEINKIAEKRFQKLPSQIKDIAISEVKKTIEGNRDKQMSLMAYYTKQALGKQGKNFSNEFIAEINLANILFWKAFIIYDDFWDEDEEADPKILPTANLYARHYTNFFSLILPKTNFNAFFHKLMDKLDSANTWETIHCRTEVKNSKFKIPKELPDYGNYNLKYEPASGHILGSVAMFYALGYKEDSEETQNLITYFKNYLIAMQINDDAHDLEEDMQRGHLSTVVTMFLQDFKEKYPNKEEIDLKKDLEEIRQIFWFKTISKACETALKYTQKSKNALEKITLLENPNPLKHYINITENVAKKGLKEQRNSVEFLENFDIS